MLGSFEPALGITVLIHPSRPMLPVKNDFKLQLRGLRQKVWQHRDEVDSGKCDGRTDAQSSLETGAGSPCSKFGLGGLRERPLGARF
jgi:hypothetical protein